MTKLTKSEQKEKLWKAAHSLLLCYLDFYRKEDYKLTGYQSWKFIQWNIYGKVMISDQAIRRFLENPNMKKSSKQKDYGGTKHITCFTAEHIVPFKIVQQLFFDKFKQKDPKYDEFKQFFLKFNSLCYVWYEEDNKLNQKGLRSEVRNYPTLEKDIFHRYSLVDIKANPTKFEKGNQLFKELALLRQEDRNIKDVLSSIKE